MEIRTLKELKDLLCQLPDEDLERLEIGVDLMTTEK